MTYLVDVPSIVADVRDNHTRLDSDECVVSALDVGDLSDGIAVPGPFQPEAVLTRLAIIHDLVWQEATGPDFSGFGRFIYGKDRQTPALAGWTMNARRPGEEFAEEDIERNRVDVRERPKVVEVTFDNADDALQVAQEKERATGFEGGREVRVDLGGCTLTRTKGRQIARRLFRESMDRQRLVRLTTTAHSWNIQEEDYFEATDGTGETWIVLVEQITESTDWFYEIEGCAVAARTSEQQPPVLNPTGTGGRGGVDEPEATPRGAPLEVAAFDLRPLRDEDVGKVGFYAAATPADGSKQFDGAVVFVKRPNDNAWRPAAVIEKPALMGYTLAALADAVDLVNYETTSEISVQVVNGTPETVTEAMVDEGHNLFLVGAGGEVVGARDATEEADGSWTLSHLSRGRLDTAGSATGHVLDEPVVRLDDALVFVPLAAEDLGTTVEVAIVHVGGSLDDVPVMQVVVSGGTVKPLPVASLTVTDNLDDTLTVSWARQALRSARFRLPAAQPAEAGDRVVLEFYNEALPNPVTKLHEVTVDGNVLQLTLDDPGGLGLTGPTVSVIARVRSQTWGDSATSGSGVDGTFDPSGATNPTVGELADVDLTGLNDGETLVWDELTETWIPGTAGGGAPDSLNDVGDVDLTGLTDGDGIVYDQGTLTWKPGRPAGAPDWMPQLATYRDWASAGLAGFTSTVLGSGSVYLTDTQNYAPDRVANVTSSVTVDGSSAVAGTNAAMLEADDVLGYAVAGRKFRVRLRVTSAGATESMRVGWMGAHTSPAANARPVSGFWIEFDRSIDATNILLVCGDGTTQSHTATSKTFASLGGTWTTFEIEFETTSSVKLYSVSAGVRTLLATHTTNVPSTDTARALRWLQQVTKYNLFGSAAPRIACEFPSYDVDLSGKEVVLP